MEDLGKISKGYKYVKATPYSLVQDERNNPMENQMLGKALCKYDEYR